MQEIKQVQREPPKDEQTEKQRPYIKVYYDWFSLELNPAELLIFSIVYSFATQSKEKEYRGSQKYLCDILTISKPTALKALNTLVKKGYLVKIKGDVKNSSRYLVNHEIINKLTMSTLSNNFTSQNSLLVKNIDKASQNSLQGLSNIFTTPSQISLHSKNNSNNTSKNNSKTLTSEKAVNESEQDNPIQSDTLSQSKNKPKTKKKVLSDDEWMKQTKSGQMFATFYNAYPKHKARKEAIRAWKKINPPPDDKLLQVMLNSIEQFKQSPEWQKDSGRYIPNPATWLNSERWTDEIDINLTQSEPKKEIPMQKIDMGFF